MCFGVSHTGNQGGTVKPKDSSRDGRKVQKINLKRWPTFTGQKIKNTGIMKAMKKKQDVPSVEARTY